ncbi:MAG: glycosyltransferase [Candidatus Sumerlaeia bacterium]
MRVRILCRLPAQGYSGGRLATITMAEGLAMAGADVDILTDAVPEMYAEFKPFSRVRLRTTDLRNLAPWADRSIDVVVIIPALNDYYCHGEFLRHAIECNARAVLLNFETPNWFNAVSPFKRDPRGWIGWEVVSEYADMIVSISAEGTRWAREFYLKAPKKCLFEHCHPGINSVLCDQVPAPPVRKKQIVFLTRLSPHKGYDMLAPLIGAGLGGYTLVINRSLGTEPDGAFDKWRAQFEKDGVALSLKTNIGSAEKFALFKESALNYFPTRFEGYGLPPLEAAYCGCPTACSDLPVLREVGGGAYAYADPTNSEAMRRAVAEALGNGEALGREYDRLARIARIEEYGARNVHLFEKLF